MDKIQGIIFDLDGTLADTLPLCIKSFQLAFE
ncbi:MAG TPA: hydrolase, partial [Cyanobacteria bacterium UBA9971]|nr:hydrolase [Cyanobacteria bacterium UBA9971]